MSEDRARDPFQPSIDRINNAEGYGVANCRIVSLAANLAMNVWGEEVFHIIALTYARRKIDGLLVQIPTHADVPTSEYL